jgi:hypothetical protein
MLLPTSSAGFDITMTSLFAAACLLHVSVCLLYTGVQVVYSSLLSYIVSISLTKHFNDTHHHVVVAAAVVTFSNELIVTEANNSVKHYINYDN